MYADVRQYILYISAVGCRVQRVDAILYSVLLQHKVVKLQVLYIAAATAAVANV
jgi:hypothetical protein